MVDTPEAEEPSPVEQYLEAFRVAAKRLPPDVRDVMLDYLVPIFEGVREEYVSGFEAVTAQIDEVADAADPGPGFRTRVLQAIATLGAGWDLTLKRAGWADAEGVPTADCPDDVKMAFGGAQALVTSLTSEIKEMQTDDVNDLDDEGPEDPAAPSPG